jgi:rubrerythrin
MPVGREYRMKKDLFDEIVQFAIDGEQEAVDAYTTASEIVTRANVKSMLLDLARQEQMHKERLESIDRERVAETAIVNVPDLRIADFMDDVTITADMDYQDILAVAMKREERAHNLYSTLASNTDDAELKKVFEVLAQEEAGHKLALEKEYDEHVLTDN